MYYSIVVGCRCSRVLYILPFLYMCVYQRCLPMPEAITLWLWIPILFRKQEITIVGNEWTIFHLHIHSTRKWWIFFCKVNKRIKFPSHYVFAMKKLMENESKKRARVIVNVYVCFWIQDTYLNFILLINFRFVVFGVLL